MKQDQPFIKLGDYDIAPIRERLLAEPEAAWSRKVAQKAGNWPHRDARHLSLANSLDGRHHDAIVFPAYARYEDLVKPLLRTVSQWLGRGDRVVRVQFAWLGAGSSIAAHRDTAITLLYSHRVHVPIASNDDVEFHCGDESVCMREGEVWTFDNTRKHAVDNRGDTPRIHMIADFAEPLPPSTWLPYLKQRLYKVRTGEWSAHRALAREHGARNGRIRI
ncbi:MAG: aspartyl/asparaginyl beta-hydroxylase domain-containing protein [Pseudomonadota bacterium]